MHYWIRTGNSLSPQPQRFLVQPRSASGAFPCDAFVQRGPPILVFVYSRGQTISTAWIFSMPAEDGKRPTSEVYSAIVIGGLTSGVILSVVWNCFLGYGLFRLVELVF